VSTGPIWPATALCFGNEDSLTHGHHDKVGESTPATRRPIHHSPLFWIGVAMCLAAIVIYVLSDDLSWRPAVK